jgi:hypothetical protein
MTSSFFSEASFSFFSFSFASRSCRSFSCCSLSRLVTSRRREIRRSVNCSAYCVTCAGRRSPSSLQRRSREAYPSKQM